jgi:hypothetical protein
MLHRERPHLVTPVATIEELAEKLVDHDWTTCTGWSCGTLILLNDSTGPDGAQEYAVLRGGRQIETLTVSWMTRNVLIDVLRSLDDTGGNVDMGPCEPKPHPVGCCHACA